MLITRNYIIHRYLPTAEYHTAEIGHFKFKTNIKIYFLLSRYLLKGLVLQEKNNQ